MGRRAWVLKAELEKLEEVPNLIMQADQYTPLYALVNSAAIFEPRTMADSSLADWERHLRINLTAPFLLSRAFADQLPDGSEGRIVNILDWRALKPGADHFPYTISKAALAAMTRSMAVSLAPRITVNGLALGAVLPPTDGGDVSKMTENIPSGRWSEPQEVQQALVFLLSGPADLTGEIIHLGGGRHLV